MAIDSHCTPSNLQDIFELLADGNDEISIARFVTYIRSRQAEKGRNRLSAAMTTKSVFRGAFRDVFGDNEIWGDSKVYTHDRTFSTKYILQRVHSLFFVDDIL